MGPRYWDSRRRDAIQSASVDSSNLTEPSGRATCGIWSAWIMRLQPAGCDRESSGDQGFAQEVVHVETITGGGHSPQMEFALIGKNRRFQFRPIAG